MQLNQEPNIFLQLFYIFLIFPFYIFAENLSLYSMKDLDCANICNKFTKYSKYRILDVRKIAISVAMSKYW